MAFAPALAMKSTANGYRPVIKPKLETQGSSRERRALFSISFNNLAVWPGWFDDDFAPEAGGQ